MTTEETTLPPGSPDWFRDIHETNNMTRAEAASWYARAGMFVFPCNDRKEPIGSAAPRGYKDASCDPEVVSAWWDAYPDANIGVAMEQSGLYAVDVDMYAGGVWVPPPGEETLRAVTASSGVHHVYRRGFGQTGPLPGKAADHVDIKDKGYILVAPSVAVSKVDGQPRGYWWDQCRPPAESREVFDSLVRGAPHPSLEGSVGGEGLVWAKEIQEAKKLREGDQRPALLRFCASLRSSGWSDRQALPMIYMFVANLANYRSADPWLPDHAMKIWTDTKANPRFDPEPLELEPGMAEAAAAMMAGPPDTTVDDENPRGWLGWDEDFWKLTKPEMLIPQTLAVGGIALVYCRSGQGKSLIAQDVCAGFAVRGKVFGQQVDKVSLLYVDHENSMTDIRDRLGSMGLSAGDAAQLKERFHYSLLGDWPPLDSREGGDALIAEVQKLGARLVVLDTNSKLVRGLENDNPTWQDLHNHTTKRLKRLGVSVIQLDHTGKDEDRGIRGAKSKVDNVDVVWKLWAAPGPHPDVRTLTCEKDRPSAYGGEGAKVSLEVRYHPLEHVLTAGGLSEAVARQEAADERVAEFVEILDALALPADIGRDRAVAAVRAAYPELKFSTGLLWEAVLRRRPQPVETA